MNRPEQQIQRAIVQYLRAAHRDLLVWHTPNGGGRSHVEAAILKGLGTLAGVPDIAVLMPAGTIGFFEVKAPKGRLSPAQKDFIERASKLGAPCRIVSSVEDVQDAMSCWLHPKLAQTPSASRAKLTTSQEGSDV
jgi:hypothetical protein